MNNTDSFKTLDNAKTRYELALKEGMQAGIEYTKKT